MLPNACGQLADVLLRAEIAARSDSTNADWAHLVGRLPSFEDQEPRRDVQRAVADEIARARERFVAMLGTATPFAALVRTSSLETAEAEMLGVLLAIEFDESRQLVVAALRGITDGFRPTLGLLRRLLPGADDNSALRPDGGLLRACLISLQADRPWARTEVLVDPAVMWRVSGETVHEPALKDDWVHIDDELEADGEDIVLIAGSDESRRLQSAARHCRGTRFVVANAPNDRAGWDSLVRYASITGRGVILRIDDELATVGRATIDRSIHVHWALTSRSELSVTQAPTRPWHEVRPDDAAATEPELMAAFGAESRIEHRLTAHQVTLTQQVLAGRRSNPDESRSDEVTAAVRRLASGELDRLAVRIRPRRGWDDLVLPKDHLHQVQDVVHRYRHRQDIYGPWGFKPLPSAGVVAMFSGPPGTGKTLSAEVIAGELGLDLFRIDLASLISKYIGETEKNLEKIFQAAEGGTMVLLFDEADAVFGKRSEVSDSNDKYANVETSYLLQRMESYDGVVIMTTNYASNIDSAFLRRIQVSVEFQPPDETERLHLWAQSFPASAPLGELDLLFLARQFKLTGSGIRSVSLGAAFRAASTGTKITMETIVLAVQSELRKQGRITTATDFGPYASVLAR